ncbi:MAG: autotransporter domain-containing protein, partial [Acetobacteraceae bacterium]
GSGTVTLNGNSSGFGGSTRIEAGALEVGDAAHPGAVLGGSVTVDAGGMLEGHGTIGGSVSNAGAVAPGGSIGILTVNGNYVQSTAGSLNIEVTPSAVPGTGYDQLQVHGAASLAGALHVLVDAGTYTLGTRYDFVHAAQGVSGSFGQVTENPAFAGYITPVVSYGASDAFLTLDPTPAPPGPAAPPPIFAGGQQAADMQTAILGAAFGVGDAVLVEGCGAPARQNSTSEQSEPGCVVRPLGHDFRSEVWLRGLGGIGNLAGSGARSSFSDSYGGLLIGYGIGFGHFTVGLGGGYLATGLNFPDGSDARQNSGVGFVYARYAVTRLRIGAMAGYGGGTIDGSRVIPGSGLTAAGNRGGNFGLFATRAAYDLPLGAYTLEPRAAFAYLHAHQAAFSETGASLLDLAYGGLNTDESDGRLSLRLLRGLTLHGWHLTPWIEAGVQQTFSGTSRTAAVSAGTFSATVAGVSPAPTAGTGGVGVRFAATKNLDGFVRYQGLFSANETASAFSAGVRYRF